MRKLLVTFIAMAVVALGSGAAWAQRGGGGMSGGGSHGGMSGGGSWSGGGSHSGSGGSWSGGGGWHGGSGGSWNGGGWHGGGYYGGGYRGYYGWRGGYWGPGFGVYWGGPGWWWGAWPYAYGYGGYGYPYAYTYGGYTGYFGAVDGGAYVQQDSAPTYVEQAQPAPAANNFWYYCTDPAGYYPYVKNCSKTWMQVVPHTNPGNPVAPRLVQ